MPLAAELVQTPLDAEFMTQSPSQTVSIYEALAEILSKPTESLNLSNSKSTDRTLFSEAPISSTTTSTTTTTTSTTPVPTTTEAKDDLKVENATLDGLDNVESVNTAHVNNQETSTEAPTTETVSELTTNSDDLTATLNYTESPLSTPTSFSPTQADTTINPTNDLQIKTTTTTTEEEFLTSTMQTTFNSLSFNESNNLTLTNNLTSFDNMTNAFNKTEIETTKMNLQLDQNQSSLKQEKIVSPSIVKRNNFMKLLTTSTVPPDYSPRFSQSNRIPILSFGVLREERKVEPTTNSNKIDLMTKKVTKKVDENNSYTTPSVYPVYRPEVETTTVNTIFNKTENPSTERLSHEDTEVTETIITSSFMTLTEVETSTVFNDEDFFIPEISTQMVNSPLSNIADTTEYFDKSRIDKASSSTVADSTTKYFIPIVSMLSSAIPDSITESNSLKDFISSSTETSSLDKLSIEILRTTPVDTTELNPLLSDKTSTFYSKKITADSFNASDTTTQSLINVKNLIEEINELTTVTDSPKITTEPSKLSFDVEPISIETSTVNPFAPAPFKLQPKISKSLFPKHPRKPDSSKIKERVVYAILPNNTVIRKTIQERLTTENPYVIYGIFPNNSVVRKFRNGTLVPDDITTHIEITNIDPKSLINANSEFHKQSSETVLEHSAIISTTNLPITDQTKTVFYLLISILNSFAQK